jgi:hypothetical protein
MMTKTGRSCWRLLRWDHWHCSCSHESRSLDWATRRLTGTQRREGRGAVRVCGSFEGFFILSHHERLCPTSLVAVHRSKCCYHPLLLLYTLLLFCFPLEIFLGLLHDPMGEGFAFQLCQFECALDDQLESCEWSVGRTMHAYLWGHEIHSIIIIISECCKVDLALHGREYGV